MSNSILTISNISIKQDAHGRFCLNDLHKASGGERRHEPKNWTSLQQTKELIAELLGEKSTTGIPVVEQNQPLAVINGGNNRGTYADKELVYAYATWISAKFFLRVIRAYDAMVNPKPYGLKELKPTYASVKMERHVSEMVCKCAAETGRHHNTVYDEIKTKFEFQKIGEIPVLTYPEICTHFGQLPKYDIPRTVTVDILDAGKAEKYQTLLQIERGELKALPAQELQALENKKHSAFIEDYDHFREYLDKNSEMGFRFVRKSDLYDLGLKILDMGI